MRKWTALLLALALLLPAALAEEKTGAAYLGEAFTFELPEGFALVEGEALEGYRRAAAADFGGDIAGEAMLAQGAGGSISAISAESASADTAAAAREVVVAYAAYIPGFEETVPENVEAAGLSFARLRFSVDGEVASQYLYVEGGRLWALTFMGMADEEALLALEGFQPTGTQRVDE